MKYPGELFIGGEWRAASDGARITVLDPATEQTLATAADGTVQDGLAAVDAAAAALPSWAATAPRARSDVLRRAFELMHERADELAALIVRENGKALPDAKGELTYAAEFFRWYAEEAVRVAGTVQTAPGGANRIVVLRQPIGVSVLVTPWNFPAAMATRKIGPALAAGCTVILKPASETPLTALAIAAILDEAGAPAGTVNVVPSTRSGAVVSAMLADPRVRKLSFTGSTEVGRTLLATAAQSVVSTSMELGGNAPFLVFDDADIDAAIEGAMIAKMRNGGQACTAANRFFVQRGIADEFGRRLAERMGALRVGPGVDPAVELGPLVNAAAVDKVSELVESTVSAGARTLIGGERPDGTGFYYPATVLADVPIGAAILGEEIFGPVAPIVTFEDEAEAVRLANDTEHGLVSYVYTGDLARGLRVSEALESGMVGLNRGLVSEPAAILPFNWPPLHFTKKSAPALAAGNTVVVKPGEQAPLAVLRLVEIVNQVLPPGVVNAVAGLPAGPALSGHPVVERITFTGATVTGQHVLRSAAENLTYATLELGGKNALLVLDDADMRTAVDISIEGMFYNQGEACTSTSRILVHRSRYDEFVERFVAAAARLTVGDGLDAATDIGAMADARQQRKVLGYIDTAVAEGAKIAFQGQAPTDPRLRDGFWVPPTVLVGVEPHHTVAQEEIFGPVASLLVFDTDDEAVAIANGTSYGLTAAVITEDHFRASRLASRLAAGMIFVNNYLRRSFLGSPFGGVKGSGFGRENWSETLHEFVRAKNVRFPSGRAPVPVWPPVD